MTPSKIQKWNLDGLLEEIWQVDQNMPDRSLAFILGAGASASSGIPTGARLAERWLQELHERVCLDKSEFLSWVKEGGHGIDRLVSPDQAAAFYPQIFERRFGGDPESGYAALEDLMEARSPSLGYSMLAEVLQKTRHRVVVTTNFDNLVSEALATHGHKAPLIVAHESLTSFVRPRLRRPLLAKIHRDLLLHPKNDKHGVDSLEAGWRSALGNLFQAYEPVVIGYGGNDGSLMGLLQSLDASDMPGRIWWCHQHGETLSKPVVHLLETHRGATVEIPPFDEFMLHLASRIVEGLDLAGISQRIERLGRARTERFRRHAEHMAEVLSQHRSAWSFDARRLARDEDHWWTWILRAQGAGSVAEKSSLLEQGMKKVHRNAKLRARYAALVRDYGQGSTEEVERIFRESLALDPADAEVFAEFAAYLEGLGRREEAEQHYARAYELDPTDDEVVRRYAIFLETAYQEPTREQHERAETMFKRALDLEPDEVKHWHNYAYFLETRGRLDEAEKHYQRAVHLAPSDPLTAKTFALFLHHRNEDDAAEAVFKKARDNDHGNADIRGNYADFIQMTRNDFATAESLYREAIALDPYSLHWRSQYADFLIARRHDAQSAEDQYAKMLELDPLNAEATVNCACMALLRNTGDSRDKAVGLAVKALQLCHPVPRQACAEALLYLSLADELRGAIPSPHLSQLKGCLEQGYPRGDWDFTQLFAAVLPGMDLKRRVLYEALGAAILKVEAVAKLSDFEDWVGLTAADPFLEIRPEAPAPTPAAASAS